MIETIAEAKIREAIEKGALDNLPGKGKPLKLEDLSRIPEEFRAGYILLKNGGYIPEEMALQNKIFHYRQLIDQCCDVSEKETLKKELSYLNLKHSLLMEKRKRQSIK
ncbi:hypothetical protein BJL90_20640 [Clostridium formicaceticum]|uniref:DnaJ homologue subfamily C member 28 conserved domain-containing protein n=1 Tax=Clostridium formicaceticum TaxID=1497 RepID=A0ABN4TB85_9CLOT|nr:hypothetical protein BJL90_20640 [Clostridium formicaceticum]